MRSTRPAHSLTELVIAIVLMSVMAMVAVPRFSMSAVGKKKASAFAAKMVTDLRKTRGLAIANAAGNSDGYELSVQGTGYQIKDMLSSSVVDSHQIDSDLNCSAGTFTFGPLGNLLVGSETSMTVSSQGKSFTVSIVTATGMVKCVED